MRASALRVLACLAVLATVGGLRADSQVTITEFMAANGKTLRDKDLEYPDWIEIHNAGPDAANLGGWFLTDATNNLAQWTFPATTLPANGYLVVFASGKDRAVSGAELHTDFRLAVEGGYVALVTPEGEIASEFAPGYPPQFVDVSYGWRLGRQYYFPKPTPGAANGDGYNDFVADTKFDHDRGFYGAPFDLIITTATADATIVCTTNGSAPTLTATATNGFVSGGPVRVAGTTVVRAAAFKAGSQPSNVDTQTYLFLDDVVRQSPTGKAPGTGWPAAGTQSTGQVIDYGMDPDIVNHAKSRDTIKNDLQSVPSFSVVMNLNDLFNTATGIYANASQDGRAWERSCTSLTISGGLLPSLTLPA
jgi:hypothetical protein